MTKAWRGFPGFKILTLELISSGVKFLYWTPQECVRTGFLCKGHQTKMLPLHSSSLFKPLGGGKRHNWVTSYSFHHIKKKLCATINLLPEKSSVSSVFGLTYSFADFTPSKKGDFSFTLVCLNCLSESEWDGLPWKVLDFIDWRLSLYTKSYLVTVAIVCCSDDFSWQSPSCNTFFGKRYLK